MSTPARRRTSHTTKLVLLAFHEAQRPMYGGEIARAAHMHEGTVHRILERFEEDGWATSADRVKSYHGPPRHYFELTDQGREVAADVLDRSPSLARTKGAVEIGL